MYVWKNIFNIDRNIPLCTAPCPSSNPILWRSQRLWWQTSPRGRAGTTPWDRPLQGWRNPGLLRIPGHQWQMPSWRVQGQKNSLQSRHCWHRLTKMDLGQILWLKKRQNKVFVLLHFNLNTLYIIWLPNWKYSMAGPSHSKHWGTEEQLLLRTAVKIWSLHSWFGSQRASGLQGLQLLNTINFTNDYWW